MMAFAQRGFGMDANLSPRTIVVAAGGQVSCPLGEEAAILNIKSSMYYGLDPVGARVWTLIQQPRSIGDLRDAIVSEYDVEAERCEQDLLDFLEKMRGEGLIEIREPAAG
jgi:Coenzyme PQQ synthesis protein D (PqqD)